MEAFKERERSQSRGRVSTGRGGAGNIRTASQDTKPNVDDGVTVPVERGRHINTPSPSRVTHAGRGGAGNVRSPSRDPADHQRTLEEDILEAQLIRERRAREAGAPHSTGLGGYGNISSRSRSREPTKHKESSPAPHGHSTGRGGAGNVAYSTDDSSTLREHDQSVRDSYEARGREGGLISTGKGGAGNMHPIPDISTINLQDRGTSPHVVENGEYGRTSGRGGAGNYIPPTSSNTGTETGTADDSRGRSPHGAANGHARGPIETVKEMVRGMSRSRSRDTPAVVQG